MAQCTSPVGMGRKARQGVYPGVGATATFLLVVRVCSECEGEGGEIEGPEHIILRARSVCLVSLKPCTAYSAGAGLICYPKAGLH